MTIAARFLEHLVDAPSRHLRRRVVNAIGLAGALAPLFIGQAARADAIGPTVLRETWQDTTRNREVPVLLRWPDAAQHPGPLPLVMFSHGLGGTVEGGTAWGEAWTAAGFVVLHLQHAGSDLPAVRQAASSFTDQRGLRTLTGPLQLLARLGDVTFALDEVARRHAAGLGHWRTVRPQRAGLAGHSFGAHTTLGMAGQRYPGYEGIDEPRLAAFVAFSPTVPPAGNPAQAFGRLTRPVLSVTGTLDSDVVGNGATPDKRMAVFAALPPGRKAHLVLKDADHMTFAGQTGRATEIIARVQATRDLQAAHHALTARITTDWWLATLSDDPAQRDAARARLQRPAGLAAGDLWELG